MKHSMITGFWNETTLVCGNHPGEAETVMTLRQTGQSLHYMCSKGDQEDSTDSEAACKNSISLKEFEQMLDEIFRALEAADTASIVLNLTNYAWKKKGLAFKVLSHTNQSIKIQVLNRLKVGR